MCGPSNVSLLRFFVVAADNISAAILSLLLYLYLLLAKPGGGWRKV